MHEASGIPDRERALVLLEQGKRGESRAWFRRALARNQSDEVSRTRLVEAYYSAKDYSSILSLYKDAGITDQSDAETVLRIADSFAQTGDTRNAISVLEFALHSREDNGPLYLALAGYYRKAGDTARAAELESKGRSRLTPTTAP
jgi:tetratricopeptide (TPR) repeat protein